ncbi:MAG: stage V sporulation protein AD [Halanaerobiales bacterium]
MAEKLKGQTVNFNTPPHIIGHSCVMGPEEGKGPFNEKFDMIYEDPKCGQDTWEKGEKQMVSDAVGLSLDRAEIPVDKIDFMLGGDLLDQIVTANYLARDYPVAFLGLYGACSTMVEGLGVGSILLDGGFSDTVLAFSSSHYQTAERQYRTPLEYGDQYPKYKQWTVTGSGACVLEKSGGKVWITHFTIGKVIDLGIKDANNMGAAMAPAAADTIMQHFMDLSRGPQDYDYLVTGDLGRSGKDILDSLLRENNMNLEEKLQDCGDLLLPDENKYGAGGSGCAASAAMLSAHFISEIVSGNIDRILLIGTGVLMNPVMLQQQESIPAIAHAVAIESVS